MLIDYYFFLTETNFSYTYCYTKENKFNQFIWFCVLQSLASSWYFLEIIFKQNKSFIFKRFFFPYNKICEVFPLYFILFAVVVHCMSSRFVVLRCISFAAWRALLRAKMGRSSELRAPLAVPCWVMDLPLNQTPVAPHTSSHAGGTLSIEQSYIFSGDIVFIMHWYDGWLCTA